MSPGGQNLDTRLLRYRSRSGDENAVTLAEDLIGVGRGGDALEVAKLALKLVPNDRAMVLMSGRAKLVSGDLLGAQATLLKLAREKPRDKAPFRWLGEVLLKRGDPARAAKVLQRAQAIDRNDTEVKRLLERAERLARVADEALAPPEPLLTHEAAPEERTVIRRDLTDQLRNLAREEAEEEAHEEAHEEAQEEAEEEAQEELVTQAQESPSGSAPTYDHETTEKGDRPDPRPVPELGPPSYDFDDEPTNIVSASFAEAQPPAPLRAPPPPPPPPSRLPSKLPPRLPSQRPMPPPPQKRSEPLPRADLPRADRSRANRTWSMGSALTDDALPSFDSVEDEATALEKKRPPLGPPKRSATSPGAASAPTPPPPKRNLKRKPSGNPDPFAASDEEIDGALGALTGKPSPFGQVDDPFAESSKRDLPFPPRQRPASSIPPPLPSARSAAPEPAPPPPEFEDEPLFGADAFQPAPARPAAPVADLSVGGGSDKENVDEVLAMLRNQGLFEPPTGAAATWAKRAEVKKTQVSGQKIGIWLGAVWVLALGLAAAGWFGWQEHIRQNHERSDELVAQATAEAYRGSHADLVDAERHLVEARELDAHDPSGPTLLLFVQAQAALEDGAFDPVHIRPAIVRAESLEEENPDITPYLNAARAVLSVDQGGHEEARTQTALALEARPTDPAILYLVGRLEQRLGGEDALAHLEAATEGEETLLAPRIALAEAFYDEGRAEEALALIDGVLEQHDDHLRALMWQAFMTADDETPEDLLESIRAHRDSIDETFFAPTDTVLFHLSEARLLRRMGQHEQAAEAVDGALGADASEPRLLALVATEGRRAGRLRAAELAARTAVGNAPANTDFRKLLAEIQIARRNGRGALSTLAELPAEDPDVLGMRAHSALLLGTSESLTAAATELDAHIEENDETSIEIQALRIRIHTRMGEAEQMLPVARALAQEAPGDPAAALALGEAALRLRQPDAAVEALEGVIATSPDHAEGYYLLGRARRMAGDPEGAETSLQRAVQLTPEHTEARLALGGLLLDTGQYEEADELYRGLASSGRSSGGRAVTFAGRIGRVEALLGLGELDDAEVQYEAMRTEVRETPTGRVTGARLRLAQGEAGEALSLIRPIARGDNVGAPVLALYGDCLLAARQTEPASNAYDAAVAIDSGLPEALLGQADMAIRTSRLPDALEILAHVQRALRVRIRPPSMHARLLTLLGRANHEADQNEEAASSLREAIATETEPPEAHFWLGETLSGSNSPDARASYERYLELAPEGPYASRARRAIR